MEINDGKTIRERDGVLLVTDEDGTTEEVDVKNAVMLANAGYRWIDDSADRAAKRRALKAMSLSDKKTPTVHVDSGKGLDLPPEDPEEARQRNPLTADNFSLSHTTMPVKIHSAKLEALPVTNYQDDSENQFFEDEEKKSKALDSARFGGIKKALSRRK